MAIESVCMVLIMGLVTENLHVDVHELANTDNHDTKNSRIDSSERKIRQNDTGRVA